jgi:hypothetical protein
MEGERVMGKLGAGSQPEAGSTTLAQISVQDFAETAFKAVMRAVEAQKFPHGPIIWGIIYQPQLGQAAIIQPQAAGPGASA